jgi:hypothetical protein
VPLRIRMGERGSSYQRKDVLETGRTTNEEHAPMHDKLLLLLLVYWRVEITTGLGRHTTSEYQPKLNDNGTHLYSVSMTTKSSFLYSYCLSSSPTSIVHTPPRRIIGDEKKRKQPKKNTRRQIDWRTHVHALGVAVSRSQ